MGASDESVSYLLNGYEIKDRIGISKKLAECLEKIKNEGPQHMAVQRSCPFFHHYIAYMSDENYTTEETIRVEIIHRNKKSIENTYILINNSNGNYSISKDDGKLFDFGRGVYRLGIREYSRDERKRALTKAFQYKNNSNEFYSLGSRNCEHFVNLCFTGNPVSYQIENENIMNVSVIVPILDGLIQNKKSFCIGGIKTLVINLLHSVCSYLRKLITPFVKSGLCALVQAFVEIISSAKKIKTVLRFYDEKIMHLNDMRKEIIKTVCSSVAGVTGEFYGHLVGGALGSFIGSLIIPGVGTVIGGVVGGTGGALLGLVLGKAVGSLVGSVPPKIVSKICSAASNIGSWLRNSWL